MKDLLLIFVMQTYQRLALLNIFGVDLENAAQDLIYKELDSDLKKDLKEASFASSGT